MTANLCAKKMSVDVYYASVLKYVYNICWRKRKQEKNILWNYNDQHIWLKKHTHYNQLVVKGLSLSEWLYYCFRVCHWLFICLFVYHLWSESIFARAFFHYSIYTNSFDLFSVIHTGTQSVSFIQFTLQLTAIRVIDVPSAYV